MKLTCCDFIDSVVVINGGGGGHLFLLIPADNVWCLYLLSGSPAVNTHARFARALPLPIHDRQTNERTNIHQQHRRIADTLSVKFALSFDPTSLRIRPRAVVG